MNFTWGSLKRLVLAAPRHAAPSRPNRKEHKHFDEILVCESAHLDCAAPAQPEEHIEQCARRVRVTVAPGPACRTVVSDTIVTTTVLRTFQNCNSESWIHDTSERYCRTRTEQQFVLATFFKNEACLQNLQSSTSCLVAMNLH